METTTCTKFRWYWAWQDHREEEWLGNMSREGWHLESFSLPGVYHFRKGAPKNYVYRLDFQTSPMKDREIYLQLFRDAGWEHLGSLSAWEYFRKEALPGEEPEIFTDPESKIKKYQRIIGWLFIFFPVMLVLNITTGRDPSEAGYLGLIPRCIMAGILILYLIAILRIGNRIRQLRNPLRK
jgi:hypothetical protein